MLFAHNIVILHADLLVLFVFNLQFCLFFIVDYFVNYLRSIRFYFKHLRINFQFFRIIHRNPQKINEKTSEKFENPFVKSRIIWSNYP